MRVAACAVCHSDVAYASGAWGGRLPAVYGHEAAGVVERGGRRGGGAAAPATTSSSRSSAPAGAATCAAGASRRSAMTFALDERSPLRSASGAEIAQGLRTAAFAEEVLVHHSQAVPVPRELPLDRACLLACGVVTGYGAVVNTAG